MNGELVGAKLAAFSAAVALHLGAVWWLHTPEQIEIAGGAAAAEAQLGNAFADMVMGVESAEKVVEVAEVVEPATEDQIQPKPLEAVKPDLTEPLHTQPDIIAMKAPEPLQTVPLISAAPVAALPEVQPPKESEITPPSPSVRPKARPKPEKKVEKPVKKAAAPKPKPSAKKPEKKKQAATPPKTISKGNAKQNANAGAASAGKAAQGGTKKGKAKGGTAGNAAASNYPGKVMKKISRVSRPKVGHKGTAVIAFKIAGNGGLAGLSVAKSSGSAKLDKAALTVVRRASPFPPPPTGARTSFSIKIEGR